MIKLYQRACKNIYELCTVRYMPTDKNSMLLKYLMVRRMVEPQND